MIEAHKKVIVIGGGPAGMMAAGVAASRGLDVTLIEKNEQLGKKLFITGKGRCNITNIADIETHIQSVPVNGHFLYSAFYTFTNQDVISFFERFGVNTKQERGGRIFPISDKSSDVIRALEKYLSEHNVQIIQGMVHKINKQEDSVKGVVLKDGQTLPCDSVVIATGGLSYPQTGSTGDGYRFARNLGHTIAIIKPSLVPLEIKQKWVQSLQGLSLKNIAITVLNAKNKKVYDDFGEMIFTHYGISGPVVLSASSHMRNIDNEQYAVSIDLKPALTDKQLDIRIQRDFEKYIRKQFVNALNDLLPKKLIPVIIDLCDIPADKPVHQITKQERMQLIQLLKNLSMDVKGFRPIAEAIVTSGGISTNEIDPSTMASKIIKGLFFAGEIIDVDAYTGGYNLQIAFSTGYLAGMHV